MVRTNVGGAKRSKIDFEKLNRWNSVAAGVLLLEAVAIVVAGVGKAFPVVLDFLGVDTLATRAQGDEVLAAGTHHLFDMSLPWVVALALAAGAATYVLMASFLRSFYEQNLAKRVNTVRWVGYGAASGLLVVAIGLLSGVQNLVVLLMLFALVFGSAGLYAIAEKCGQKSPSAATCNYWLGSVLGLVAWLGLGLYAWGAHVYGASLDAWFHVLCVAAFLLQAAVAANFYMQLRATGKWADYLYGERLFMGLHFVLLSAAAWVIFAGSLRP